MPSGARYEPSRYGRAYHTLSGESYVYAAAANPNAYTARMQMRPQFSSDIGSGAGALTIFQHAGDASNFYELNYDSGNARWRFVKVTGGSSFAANSRIQNFSVGDEVEVGVYSDPTSGLQVAVNGSTNGSSHHTNISSLATAPATLYFGNNAGGTQSAEALLDDFEAMVKARSVEYFAERYRKPPNENTNAKLTYTGSLDTGDILHFDSYARRVVSRVKLWDASASTETDVLTNLSIMTSRLPIMAENESMFYFPNSIPGGVEIRYRKNWQ